MELALCEASSLSKIYNEREKKAPKPYKYLPFSIIQFPFFLV
jgi:hypothetical protein